MSEKIKTGTTCVGLLFKDGVILAADRRTTAGFIASDKTKKVYDLSKNVVATTAGTASDNQKVMRHMRGEVKLMELKTERSVKVQEVAMVLNSIQYSILRTQGGVVSVVLGGYDEEGPSLYNLSPDGTILENEGYVADGSGSIYVKGVFDMEYKPNMSQKEALELIEKGFKASFKNDNASGGGYIAKIVTKNGIEEVARKQIKSELVDE